MLASACLLPVLPLLAEDFTPPLSHGTNSQAAEAAQTAYRKADAAFQKDPDNASAAWQFGRACFDVGEFAKSKADRARVAEEGIAACRRALELQTNSPEAQYYLGMNLGQLARTKGFGALKLVGQLRRAFERAAELDEKYDYAGPARNLGLLFRDAPSWTVGDKKKALEQLRRSVLLAPGYPDNRIELIEAYLKWNDNIRAAEELAALEEIWPAARKEFAGGKWELAWPVWEERKAEFKAKLQKLRKKE